MREIKFRAWDCDANKMIFTFDGSYQILINSEEGSVFCGGYMDNGDWQEPKLMQYTGLKDKNGKDIYEGDIILWDYEKIVVSYGIQGVDAFEGIGYNLWSHYGQKQDGTRLQSEIEVIGNIYENPELLKNH